ncbi:MAG: CDP-alcohol phosphatidyltransferase family protein [Pseudomonadota bacterium]
MLDGWARQYIDPPVERAAQRLASAGVTANGVTLAGFVLGCCAATAIVYGQFWLALALILVSRIADGLDGAVARAGATTSDFGGFLDITLDFAFYGLIPLAFIIAEPSTNGVAGAVLLLSFYVNGASFLAYAIMAEKRKFTESPRGKKSLFYTTGLAEATETIAVFCAWCVFPAWFPSIAWVFAAVVFYTAFSRIMLARGDFS